RNYPIRPAGSPGLSSGSIPPAIRLATLLTGSGARHEPEIFRARCRLSARRRPGHRFVAARRRQCRVVAARRFRRRGGQDRGLGPDVLHARNPQLVVVRVSGWGQDGPYRDRPGFGTLVESMSGYAARTGFADRAPVLPPTALADMVAGLHGAFAVMVALRRVEVEGGAGQVID